MRYNRLLASMVCLAVLLFGVVTSPSCQTLPEEGDAPWPLAVRIMSYGDYQEDGYAHLQSIGVKYVFMSAPEASEVDAVRAKLAKYGLTPLVFRGSAELSKETFAQDLAPQLAVCEAMGVKYMFISAKRGESSLETAYARLRAAGDIAKKHGVTVDIETHPDLGTNGDVQVATMQAIGHPNIRVNFDTANVTYYNHGTSAVAELKKSIEYVRTVEFKDHTGGFETWDFPRGRQRHRGLPRDRQDAARRALRRTRDHRIRGHQRRRSDRRPAQAGHRRFRRLRPRARRLRLNARVRTKHSYYDNCIPKCNLGTRALVPLVPCHHLHGPPWERND